jgi:hypothetical protein
MAGRKDPYFLVTSDPESSFYAAANVRAVMVPYAPLRLEFKVTFLFMSVEREWGVFMCRRTLPVSFPC